MFSPYNFLKNRFALYYSSRANPLIKHHYERYIIPQKVSEILGQFGATFTLDCFEIGDYAPDVVYFTHDGDTLTDYTVGDISANIIEDLEALRQKYNETKDKRYWKELVRWLPNGWLQTRTVTMNYENLRSMYHQREHHKLTEWHSFCDWVKTLPYAQELIID